MTGSGAETLTAALRRFAAEHATGVLSVATPGRQVVLELADGVPVGIGPPHDVTARTGQTTTPGITTAAVIDDLVDEAVAAIVGRGGDWAWDEATATETVPVPSGLAAELSRRAVDAAQALTQVGPDAVLEPGRDLATTGDVDRVRALFDGHRTVQEVAAAAGLTIPATATIAAALAHAGALTQVGDGPATSWTAAVADATEDDDEPELWVMDDPDEAAPTDHRPQPATPTAGTGTGEAAGWAPSAEADASDEGWDDTTWMDELDADVPSSSAPQEAPTQAQAPTPTPAPAPDDSPDDGPEDTREALTSMLDELQGNDPTPPPATSQPTPPAGQAPGSSADRADDAPAPPRPDATRKEPKAEPAEVAEFLRELSRLALDDE